MMKIRNYFIAFAVVFAISSAYALIGVQDAKAQSTMGDLIKRIEALESKGDMVRLRSWGTVFQD